MKFGTNIHKINNEGMTPLLIACEYGHINIKCLIKSSTNINIVNNDEIPLTVARKNEHKDIVEYFGIFRKN